MHDHLYLGLLVMCMVTWLGISQNNRSSFLPDAYLTMTQMMNVNNNNNHLTAVCPGTTRVGRYQKKHSPTHTHAGQRTSLITFLHL